MGKAINVIISVGLLVLVVFALIFIGVFTQGFTSDFATFYVGTSDRMILDDVTLDLKLENEFSVNYVFAELNKNHSEEYTVRIVPNGDIEYKFTVDSEEKSLSDIEELTTYFDLKKNAGTFTLNLEDKPMRELLSEIFPGKAVECSEDKLSADYYFKLVVESYNGESVININFRPYVSADGVEIDKDEVEL